MSTAEIKERLHQLIDYIENVVVLVLVILQNKRGLQVLRRRLK